MQENLKNYFSWDETFMNIAKVIAKRSKDPNEKNGACLVDEKNIIIGLGYNGFPRGCSDDALPWVREGKYEDTKYAYVVHAEKNAVLNTSSSTKGSRLYCTLYPCNECAKVLIQKGITEIVYEDDKYHDDEKWISSRRMLELAGIKTRQYKTENSLIFKNDHLAKIFLYDEFSPQDTAMMQALYSRSPQSVVEHVEKVKNSGSGKFMETFYVGYGHASIADCGSTTLFIEKISILADKAVQDWPLYSGQETSTRYVDMSKQPIIDPIGTPQSKAIHDKWMDFYLLSQPAVENFLKEKHPRKVEENQVVYGKAIKARTFDILRSFLPAGITTQLSWHTNLRQAWDKLCYLRHNPLPEVKYVADMILSRLKEKYTQSFSHDLIDEQENYRALASENYFYYKAENPVEFSLNTNISSAAIQNYSDIIRNRPPKTGLPHFLSELGTVTFDFLLDFGSFRDIQRHRNGVCRMPLLTTDLGFNSWYLEQLPPELLPQAERLIAEQREAISHLGACPDILQYYIALGFNVACRNTYGLPATVYVVELRSGKAVHPTLRKLALQMRQALLDAFPGLVLNCDLDPSDWDISRGFQDIIKKDEILK